MGRQRLLRRQHQGRLAVLWAVQNGSTPRTLRHQRLQSAAAGQGCSGERPIPCAVPRHSPSLHPPLPASLCPWADLHSAPERAASCDAAFCAHAVKGSDGHSAVDGEQRSTGTAAHRHLQQQQPIHRDFELTEVGMTSLAGHSSLSKRLGQDSAGLRGSARELKLCCRRYQYKFCARIPNRLYSAHYRAVCFMRSSEKGLISPGCRLLNLPIGSIQINRASFISCNLL